MDKVVGGVRVGGPHGQEVFSLRVGASNGVVSGSSTTGGQLVWSLSSFQLFYAEGVVDNVYRIALHDGDFSPWCFVSTFCHPV